MTTTAVYEIKLDDNRVFRVFCANSAQVKRFWLAEYEIEPTANVKTIANGIHTIKQFEQIAKTF